MSKQIKQTAAAPATPKAPAKPKAKKTVVKKPARKFVRSTKDNVVINVLPLKWPSNYEEQAASAAISTHFGVNLEYGLGRFEFNVNPVVVLDKVPITAFSQKKNADPKKAITSFKIELGEKAMNAKHPGKHAYLTLFKGFDVMAENLVSNVANNFADGLEARSALAIHSAEVSTSTTSIWAKTFGTPVIFVASLGEDNVIETKEASKEEVKKILAAHTAGKADSLLRNHECSVELFVKPNLWQRDQGAAFTLSIDYFIRQIVINTWTTATKEVKVRNVMPISIGYDLGVVDFPAVSQAQEITSKSAEPMLVEDEDEEAEEDEAEEPTAEEADEEPATPMVPPKKLQDFESDLKEKEPKKRKRLAK